MKLADIGSITAYSPREIAQLAAAFLAIATPAAASSEKPAPATPFLDFYCEYGDKSASKVHPEGFNFSFKPSVPYDFIDMFDFEHSIRATTVTPDQVIEHRILMNDSKHPSRAEVFGVIIMDRKTLNFRRIIYKVDLKTQKDQLEMDRSGLCKPAKPLWLR
jgi:hypothetical protein